MSEMIERVARAIRAASMANQGVEALPDVVLTPNERKAYLPIARAAISAMAVPTEGMMASAIRLRAEGHPLPDIWLAMITAAIWEDAPKG